MLLENFYEIKRIEESEGKIIAEITLNSKHDIYNGHFPGNPVVPGVCLITITKELLEEVLGQTLQLSEAGNIKFLGVINPELQKQLNIELDILENENGSLKAKSQITANGQICFKATGLFNYGAVLK